MICFLDQMDRHILLGSDQDIFPILWIGIGVGSDRHPYKDFRSGSVRYPDFGQGIGTVRYPKKSDRSTTLKNGVPIFDFLRPNL